MALRTKRSCGHRSKHSPGCSLLPPLGSPAPMQSLCLPCTCSPPLFLLLGRGRSTSRCRASWGRGRAEGLWPARPEGRKSEDPSPRSLPFLLLPSLLLPLPPPPYFKVGERVNRKLHVICAAARRESFVFAPLVPLSFSQTPFPFLPSLHHSPSNMMTLSNPKQSKKVFSRNLPARVRRWTCEGAKAALGSRHHISASTHPSTHLLPQPFAPCHR